MKINRIAFICSIIIFFISWGIKTNIPVERPSNLNEPTQEAWFEKEYTNDEQWYSGENNPDNYTKVKGYESIYQYAGPDGSISYYREKINESGDKEYVKIEDFKP